MDTAKVTRKSFKFRIYPSKSQVAKLENTLDLCRELYNAALQERRDAWRLERKSISFYDQQNQLPEIKKIREDLKTVHSQVLCDAIKRVDNTFRTFFKNLKQARKAGFPRFQNKNRYNSFTFTQCGFLVKKGNLEFSKIGKIKIKLHRQIVGKIKTCTVKRNSNNKWFATFSVECEKEILEPTNKYVGIDVGLIHFATLSDGETVSNPRFFKVDEKELAKNRTDLINKKKFQKKKLSAGKWSREYTSESEIEEIISLIN